MNLGQVQDELLKKCKDFFGNRREDEIAEISFDCCLGSAIREIKIHTFAGQIHTVPEDAFTKL